MSPWAALYLLTATAHLTVGVLAIATYLAQP